jgi:hypothetical protein
MNPTAVLAGTRRGLGGRVVARDELGPDTVRAMFSLLSSHFDGVDRQTFDVDLAGKDAVILLEDDARTLRGFSTLRVFRSLASGRHVRVVYSGDTIVERKWWGSPALARTWVRAVRSLAPGDGGDLYWMLLTSGFRTYRFLPVFFQQFHPCLDEATPAAARSLTDAVASRLFGARYDAERGIVRFERPQVLAGELIDVPAGRAADPHVRFFLERNPGYLRGDELVCLTRVHDDNLTPAGRRMVMRAGE